MGFLENRIVREIDETNKRDYFTTVFTFRETNEVWYFGNCAGSCWERLLYFLDEVVYDAGFLIQTAFLLKYGTHEQLTIAFQNYIDNHQLPYVKTNLKKRYWFT